MLFQRENQALRANSDAKKVGPHSTWSLEDGERWDSLEGQAALEIGQVKLKRVIQSQSQLIIT